MKMPFGKHLGVDLRDLPPEYLSWICEKIELRDPLKTAIEYEIEARARAHNSTNIALRFPSRDAALLKEIFEKGYRAAALTYHPDHGGSPEIMRQLTGLMASVRAQLGAAAGVRW